MGDLTSEIHNRSVWNTLAELGSAKYAAGQAEHGGRLWRKGTLRHALDEVLDLCVYLLTWLTIQQPQVQMELRAVGEADDLATAQVHAKRALNIIEIGNADGEKETEHADGD